MASSSTRHDPLEFQLALEGVILLQFFGDNRDILRLIDP
jgi:hypothetical protein